MLGASLNMMCPSFSEISSNCSVDEKMSTTITQEKCQTFSNDINLLFDVLILTNLANIVLFLCSLHNFKGSLSSVFYSPLPKMRLA